MTRTRIILLASVLLVFAAGTSLGLYISRSTQPPPPPPPDSRLSRELNLTPEQREQMRKIWDENVGPSHWRAQEEKRRALAKQRDEEITALLSEEQKAKYDTIQKNYRVRTDEISQDRRKAFELVDELTRKMLTPEQIAKFDEMRKAQRERGPGSGPGPGDFGPRGPRHRHTAHATEPNPSQQPPRVEEPPPADVRNP